VKFTRWRKEESLEYTTPELEVVGPGSELVQAFVGPHNDGGFHSLSMMAALCSSLEEE
jgi:hypothetical protein